jgi:hypothetical protein
MSFKLIKKADLEASELNWGANKEQILGSWVTPLRVAEGVLSPKKFFWYFEKRTSLLQRWGCSFKFSPTYYITSAFFWKKKYFLLVLIKKSRSRRIGSRWLNHWSPRRKQNRCCSLGILAAICPWYGKRRSGPSWPRESSCWTAWCRSRSRRTSGRSPVPENINLH